MSQLFEFTGDREASSAAKVRALEALLIEKGVIATDSVDVVLKHFETMAGPFNGAKIVARAWVDPDYARRLVEDTPKAIAELSLPLGMAGAEQGGDLLARLVHRRPDDVRRAFVGKLDDMDKVALLKLCYAVSFPSHLRSEAFGISLLEGAMFGKPMISSEIGTGTTYINIHQQTGLVVPPSDHEALREAMRTLWDDPQLASEMGRRAEARYWQLFTAEQMADGYVSLYQELVARREQVGLTPATRLG